MFFNSFITNEHNPGFNPSFELIDGQQRITSFFLLIIAIYKLSIDKNYINITKILQPTLFNQQQNNRLRLRGVTNDYLLRIINNNIPVEKITTTSIFDNFYFAQHWTEQNLISENVIERFLSDKISNKFINEVIIETQDKLNSADVFSQINSNGIPLCAYELILSYILNHKASEEQNVFYDTYWRKIVILRNNYSITDEELDQIFFWFLTMQLRRKVTKKYLYQEFLSYYMDEQNNINVFIEKFTDFLNKFIEIKFLDTGNLDLHIFRKLSRWTTVPLLVNWYNDERFNELLHTINITNIRRLICQQSQDAAWAYTPTANFTDIKIAIQNVSRKEIRPSEEEVLYSFDRIDNKMSKTILQILNKSFDETEYELEHIFPQKPMAGMYLNDSALTENIGNLTLLQPKLNLEASNKDFNFKKALYNESRLPINMYFKNINIWDDQQIIQRKKDILNKTLSL